MPGHFAHARFRVQYPEDCKVPRKGFRVGKLALSDRRWADLVAINAEVDRAPVWASP
jgi:predicted transglutaminase-like cysteine proteinase